MHKKLVVILLLVPFLILAQQNSDAADNRVISEVDSSLASNMVLKQQFEVNVPLDAVWNAYTTKLGWESWAVPMAEMNFKIGGLIRTRYDKEAKIGDPGTITLHVVNFIPKTMITLQAELGEHFPAFMKEDADNMYNIIYFESLSRTKTQVTSYGVGYKKNQKYIDLLKFFISGNEASYDQLISYLETGKAIKF